MPEFNWTGKNARGANQGGVMEAADIDAVKLQLRRMKITPVKVAPKQKDLFENIQFMQPSVKETELVVFSRQFATMIDAGLPLVQCLEILHSQQANSTFKKALKSIKEDVEGGFTFAESLQKYPKIFNELFVNMIAAGEAGGILDVILNRLASYLEKAMGLKKKVIGALIYPAIVVVIAALVIAVIMVWVIPVFEDMFTGMGGQLPAPTQIVVNMSNFMRHNILYMIGGIIAVVIAFRAWRKTRHGAMITDRFFLKAPIFGPLLTRVAVAKFTRTLGTMLSSGVSILEGLKIVAKTAGNKVVEEAIIDTRTAISEGQTIADPLTASGIFPPMVSQMIAVGESTGALDAMLIKVADFYDDEVDAAVGNLTAMIEPIMMVFLGVTIGGIIVAMYLPIFKLAGAVAGN
ncbi:MAG: type II secretion system F family protein [Pseudomonadota bacterium]